MLEGLFELHAHTTVSDGASSPLRAVLEAKRKGLAGIFITDHDTFRGSIQASKAARIKGLEIAVGYGAELVVGGGHVIVACPEPPPEDPRPGVSLGELRDWSSGNNCVLIGAHPFHVYVGATYRLLYRSPSMFDAVEVWNAKGLPVLNLPAIQLARRLGLPGVSGSDAHVPSMIGTSPTLVEASESLEEVLDSIRKGKCKPTLRLPSPRAILEDMAWSIYKILS